MSAVNLLGVCDSCETVVQLFRRRAGKNKTPENVKRLRDTHFFQLSKMYRRNKIVQNKAVADGNEAIPNSRERKKSYQQWS